MAEQENTRRSSRRDEDIEQRPEGGSEDRSQGISRGRTPGDTATSSSSAGATQEATGRSRNAVGSRQKMRSRPGPGGTVEEIEEIEEDEGFQLPFTGESSSTRGSTFEENPSTGETAEEEEGEFLRESLERRTRGYESG